MLIRNTTYLPPTNTTDVPASVQLQNFPLPFRKSVFQKLLLVDFCPPPTAPLGGGLISNSNTIRN